MCHCQAFCDILCHNTNMITITDIQIRLREAIKNSGMTQKEIARAINVSTGTISKYMRIDKFPSLDTFANLCKAIDVSADEILGLNI